MIRHNWGHAISFSYDTMINLLQLPHTHGKCFGFQHGLKRFHKYFIGSRYLREALNG